MGLDYSYILIFKRQDVWKLLEGVAELSTPGSKLTSVLYPDHTLELPFEAWSDTPEQIFFDDVAAQWDFMTCLDFEPDDALIEYAKKYPIVSKEISGSARSISVGVVYLTAFNELRHWGGHAKPDLIALQFQAATSNMSILFCESTSIRASMIQLLEQHDGVYGMIDLEDSAELIWWQGKAVTVGLPHAYLGLDEIEAMLPPESPKAAGDEEEIQFCLSCGKEFSPQSPEEMICPVCRGETQPKSAAPVEPIFKTILEPEPTTQPGVAFCIIHGGEFTPTGPDQVICPECAVKSAGAPTPAGDETRLEPQPVPVPTAEEGAEAGWQPGDTLLDTYTVVGLLGVGGMGKVYRVHHNTWNIDMAVKSPRAEFFQTQEQRDLFISEAETWVNLGLHPHIVTCYYVRSLEGIPRVFAELVEGGSLADWIEQGRIKTIEQALDIATQFAWGLAYAHEQGLVHRDVKPANVLMMPDGIAKVTDFGLVKAGKGMTPAYASPEQAEGQIKDVILTSQSDIWSWALSVLEMFAGSAFWVHKDMPDYAWGQVAPQALEHYLGGEVKGATFGEMPTALADLLRQCFLTAPKLRPDTMQSIALQLSEIYQQSTGQKYPRKAPKMAELKADSLNNKALTFIDLGREDEAENCWQEALKFDPTHFEAVMNYGYWRWQHSSLADDALIEKIQAIESKHGVRLEYHWLLGCVQAERGDLLSAKNALTHAWQAGIREAVPLLAGCLLGMGEEAEARQFLQNLDQSQLETFRRQIKSTAPEQILAWYASHPFPWRRCRMTISEHRPQTGRVTITSDGRFAISADYQQAAFLDLQAGRIAQIIKLPHETYAQDAFVRPDGKRTIVTCNDCTLRVFDLSSGKETAKKKLADDPCSMAVTPDFQTGIIFDSANKLQIWDLAKLECISVIEIPYPRKEQNNNRATISADGRLCVLSVDKDLVCINLRQQKLVFRKKDVEGMHSYYCRRYGLTADGQRLLLPAEENSLCFWDLKNDQRILLKGHREPAVDLAVSADGAYGVSISHGMYAEKENTLRLWSLEEGRCLWTEKIEVDPSTLALQPGGETCLVEGNHGPILRYDLTTGRERNVQIWSPLPTIFSRPVSGQTAFAIAQKLGSAFDRAHELERAGRWKEAYTLLRKIQAENQDHWQPELMSALARVGQHGRRTKLRDATLRRVLPGHTGRVFDIGLHPDQKTLISCSDDGELKFWEFIAGECLQSLKVTNDWLRKLEIYPDGRQLLVSGGGGRIPFDHAIRLFQLLTPSSPVLKCAVNLSDDPFQKVCLIPGSRLAACLFKKQITIFDPATGRIDRDYNLNQGHRFPHSPTSMWISPDGQKAFTTGTDDFLCTWNLRDGKLFSRIKHGLTEGKFTPDGRQLIARDKNSVGFWDLAEMKPTISIEIGTLSCFIPTRDNKTLFIANEDREVQGWDVPSGSKVIAWMAHDNHIERLLLTNDERYLLSSSWDTTIKVWELDWDYTFP